MEPLWFFTPPLKTLQITILAFVPPPRQRNPNSWRPEVIFHTGVWRHVGRSLRQEPLWWVFTWGAFRWPTAELLLQLSYDQTPQQRCGRPDCCILGKEASVLLTLKVQKLRLNVKCRPDPTSATLSDRSWGPRPSSAGTETRQQDIDFQGHPWPSNGLRVREDRATGL